MINLWLYYHEMKDCERFYKNKDLELSNIFKEEASWAISRYFNRVKSVVSLINRFQYGGGRVSGKCDMKRYYGVNE